MSGKWDDPTTPNKNWVCVDEEDLGPGNYAICEMCEVREIRFLHTMHHPKYPEDLVCGWICAGKMEEDYQRAHDRDRRMRLTAAKRDHWISRKGWKVSARDNRFLRYGNFLIVVYPLSKFGPAAGFGFMIKDRTTDLELIKSRKPLPDQRAAMLRTFDAVQWLEQRGISP